MEHVPGTPIHGVAMTALEDAAANNVYCIEAARHLESNDSGTFGANAVATALLVANARLANANQQLREKNHRLERALQTDELTQLGNHRHLAESFERLVMQKVAFGVTMYDLTNFKMVNDRRGHNHGDLVLQAFADTLRSTRENDQPLYIGHRHLTSKSKSSGTDVRKGGDEFMVITVFTPDTASVDIGNQRANQPHLATDLDAQMRMLLQGSERISADFSAHPIVFDINQDDQFGPQLGVRSQSAIYQPGDTLETLTARADVKAYDQTQDSCRQKVHPGQEAAEARGDPLSASATIDSAVG